MRIVHGISPYPSMQQMQLPPKCATCQEHHPTYSYQCKAKPPPETDKPELVVPLRVPETTEPEGIPEKHPALNQPVTVEQLLAFITLTLQNVKPSQRSHTYHKTGTKSSQTNLPCGIPCNIFRSICTLRHSSA